MSDLGALLTQRTPSFESIFQAFQEARAESHSLAAGSSYERQAATLGPIIIASSCAVVGSRTIPSDEVDRAFGMPPGKLRLRAGIESLAYAAEDENELTLGARAAQQTLHAAACGVQNSTGLSPPAKRIVAILFSPRSFIPNSSRNLRRARRRRCILGLLNGIAVAQGLIAAGPARTIVVISSDVHSRIFRPGCVAGEFGGLFGDGASAFLLRATSGITPQHAYALGEFFFGCAGQYAGAIRVTHDTAGQLDVHFDGEALSRAAITRLEKVIRETELRSGIARAALHGLATHQPNPRLVRLLAEQLGLPQDLFPPVAQKFGNLGSSTCGVALDAVLRSVGPKHATGPIFMASLGPGLFFGGGWLIST